MVAGNYHVPGREMLLFWSFTTLDSPGERISPSETGTHTWSAGAEDQWEKVHYSQETVFKLGYILAFFFDLGNCCSAVFYHHWYKHLGCGDLHSFLTGLKELLLSFA